MIEVRGFHRAIPEIARVLRLMRSLSITGLMSVFDDRALMCLQEQSLTDKNPLED